MKKSSVKKTLLISCTGLLIVLFCLVLIIYDAWQNPAGAFLKDALSPATGQATPAFKQNADAGVPQKDLDTALKTNQQNISILLLGIDSSEAREEKNMGWRSDMMMLCTFNTQKNTIALTTIPRDTRTNVYHVDKDGNPTKKGLDKINAAYSYGGGPDKYGPQNAMRAVSDFLTDACGRDISIQYYISTDLDNISKLADSFGGVPVQLDVDFPNLGKKGETVVINSSNTYEYLGNRHDVGGDLARARHQEEFLLSMMKKFKANQGVESLTGLLGYAARYARTNLTFEQDVALASLLNKCNIGAVDYRSIGGDFQYIGGVSYFLPDAEDVRNRINALVQ
jgi:cell envelope-related function transcriptional attenuator common domain